MSCPAGGNGGKGYRAVRLPRLVNPNRRYLQFCLVEHFHLLSSEQLYKQGRIEQVRASFYRALSSVTGLSQAVIQGMRHDSLDLMSVKFMLADVLECFFNDVLATLTGVIDIR